MDFFKLWNEDLKKEIWADKEMPDWWSGLTEAYSKTEEIFGNRQEDGQNKEQEYNKIEREIEEKFFCKQLSGEDAYEKKIFQKLLYLTKGNLLLRKGQTNDEYFFNSEDLYDEAAILLEQVFEPDSCHPLDLLIKVNWGKYFRNKGKHGRRSNYWRALDEFQEIQTAIEKQSGAQLRGWETHLWLEATVNIGRSYRYLYQLEAAESCLLSLCSLTESLALLQEHFNTTSKAETDPPKLLCKNENLFKSYFLQAGIQLGIIYQKERDYKKAKEVFEIVKAEDPGNFDAENNLWLLERKNAKTEETEAGETQSTERIKNALEYFKKIKDTNRFARINYWKCRVDLWQQKKRTENPEAEENDPGEELEKICRDNPNDLELKLILACYYQAKSTWNGSSEPEFRDNHEIDNHKIWEKSQRLFCEIYEKSPYVRKGTIGLKAYYNMVQDLIARKKFYQAKKELKWILKECDETLPASNEQKPQNASDSQPREILTKIDLGWCLINLGEYDEAKKIYTELLKEERNKLYPRNAYNRMKILNNLGECCLRLGDLAEAEKYFEEVLQEEPDNVVANRYLGHCLSLEAEAKEKKEEKTCFRKRAEEIFERGIISKPDDIYLNAGRVINRLKLWELEGKPHEGELSDGIENTILYSSQRFSVETVFGMARFIETRLEENRKDVKNKQLLRALARIRLEKQEEGYNAFRNFQDQEYFRKLPSEMRGKVLLRLFKLYHAILEIKRQCRLTLKDFRESPLPVHYTKIEILRMLLPKDPENPGKLRLWNTAYMNDSYEGNTFLELLKEAGEDEENKKPEIIPRYFQYLDNSYSKVFPRHGNVYIISFSRQRDSIPMWNTYADNAQGCALTFAKEFFDIHSDVEEKMGVSAYSDADYPLYEVQYIGETEKSQTNEKKDTGISKMEIICQNIKEIREELHKLEEILADTATLSTETADVIREFAADRMNEIRFLFKNQEYEHEKELRLVRYSLHPEVDEYTKKFDVPRLFVEVGKDIRLKEVCLGSKVDPFKEEELVTWLYYTGKVENVTKSQRHFR